MPKIAFHNTNKLIDILYGLDMEKCNEIWLASDGKAVQIKLGDQGWVISECWPDPDSDP